MNISKSKICEHMRKQMVASMQFGGTFAVALGHLPISFNSQPMMPFDEKVDTYRYHDKEFFDADYIFDFKALRDPEQY